MSSKYLTRLSDLTDILEILRFNLGAIVLCGRMEYHKTGFSMFRDNLLAQNHWHIFSSLTFKLVSKIKFKILGLLRNKFLYHRQKDEIPRYWSI